jgi:molecular chaperone GrpE
MATNASNRQTDHAVADAALESVAAEHRTQPRSANDAATQARSASEGTGSKFGSTDKKLAELEREAREANDRALRSHAELENYRKRAQRELADERKYAVVPFVRDLLPVVDNLERAIDAANVQINTTLARSASEGNVGTTTSDLSHLLDGVKMVATQLESVLKQHEAVRIETVGTAFDPNFHQALAQEPSDQPAGTITRAAQSGYKLHDRVIRPAQVFVSMGPTTK